MRLSSAADEINKAAAETEVDEQQETSDSVRIDFLYQRLRFRVPY